MILIGNIFISTTVTILISVLTFGYVVPVFAQDLSDNETCLECHADDEWVPPGNLYLPHFHDPEGGFFIEDHDGFSCNECHTYIVDLEHEDTAGDNKVDCGECHDEVPKKE